MKTKFTKLLAVTALAATSLGAPALAEEGKIKVGLILSLSGPGSVLGQEMQKGADLALEMLEGKLGGKAAERWVPMASASWSFWKGTAK